MNCQKLLQETCGVGGTPFRNPSCGFWVPFPESGWGERACVSCLEPWLWPQTFCVRVDPSCYPSRFFPHGSDETVVQASSKPLERNNRPFLLDPPHSSHQKYQYSREDLMSMSASTSGWGSWLRPRSAPMRAFVQWADIGQTSSSF